MVSYEMDANTVSTSQMRVHLHVPGVTLDETLEKGRVLGGSARAVGQEHGGSWLPDPQVSSSQS